MRATAACNMSSCLTRNSASFSGEMFISSKTVARTENRQASCAVVDVAELEHCSTRCPISDCSEVSFLTDSRTQCNRYESLATQKTPAVEGRGIYCVRV
jgi:hypothetical protein